MRNSIMIGERFGRLTVIAFDHKDKHGRTVCLCKCDCGNEKEVAKSNLTSGNSKSCGCVHKEQLVERMKTHGETGSRLYWIWGGMKSRCLNPNDPRFADYGGRGIKICDEWNGFAGFREWAMSTGYSDKLTIDRIDVNGNYEPSNCRWATIAEQANNKRTNVLVTHNGETHTLKQWSEILGINYFTLHSRIVKRGWSIERALKKPAKVVDYD